MQLLEVRQTEYGYANATVEPFCDAMEVGDDETPKLDQRDAVDETAGAEGDSREERLSRAARLEGEVRVMHESVRRLLAKLRGVPSEEGGEKGSVSARVEWGHEVRDSGKDAQLSLDQIMDER